MDLSKLVNKVKKSLKDDSRKKSIRLGSEMQPISTNPEDYVVLPDELHWPEITGGLLGLPFGKVVQIAGDSDTGKTSMCISAMKAALQQDVIPLYVETEGKTAPSDLEAWGVDPKKVLLVQSSIAEEAFDSMFLLWDAFYDEYPDKKLLVIIDSWGNTISMRDSEIDLTEDNQKPGGNSKVNRVTLNKLIAKMKEDKAAILIVNYTYDNFGSPGKTNAGGKALHFFTYIGFQTTRVSWLHKEKNGRKIRTGARVKWTTYKNHAAKASKIEIPHSVEFDIDSKGMRCRTFEQEAKSKVKKVRGDELPEEPAEE